MSKRTCFRRRSVIDADEAVITGTAFLFLQHLLNGARRVAHLIRRSVWRVERSILLMDACTCSDCDQSLCAMAD